MKREAARRGRRAEADHPGLGRIAVATLLAGGLLAACGFPDAGTLFGGESGGTGGGGTTSNSSGGGSGGATTSSSSSSSTSSSSSSSSSSASSSSSSSSASSSSSSSASSSSSSSSSSTSGGPVCGNGVCEEPVENTALCHQDCPGSVCGNGTCEPPTETEVFCPQDCTEMPTGPTCPHSVCNSSPPAAPLNGGICTNPCVDIVCAQKPSCCGNNGNSWDASCDALGAGCGGEPCVLAVCAAKPSCCTNAWTQECVQQAMNSCNVTCSCGHSICQAGAKLDESCNPCVKHVCQVDAFCCDNNWDGACVTEVETVCGIMCN